MANFSPIFCIDITSVLEIRGWTPATPVPQSPHYMKGVVNLRGSVLPIIDLAARLGLPTTEPSARHAIMVANCRAKMAISPGLRARVSSLFLLKINGFCANKIRT